MKRIYGILLRLYPRDYRALFASEMLSVFREAAEERRERGCAAVICFTLIELSSLVRGSAAEWIAKLTSKHSSATRVRTTDELAEVQKHIDYLVSRMDYAIAHHQFAKVRFFSEAERSARERLRQLRETHTGA